MANYVDAQAGQPQHAQPDANNRDLLCQDLDTTGAIPPTQSKQAANQRPIRCSGVGQFKRR